MVAGSVDRRHLSICKLFLLQGLGLLKPRALDGENLSVYGRGEVPLLSACCQDAAQSKVLSMSVCGPPNK